MLLNSGLREILRRSSKASGTWRSHWSSKLAVAAALTNAELGGGRGSLLTTLLASKAVLNHCYFTYTTLTSGNAPLRYATQHHIHCLELGTEGLVSL